MSGIHLSTDLSDRYELLADDLDGFEDARELVEYVLESTADEVERREATGATGDGTAVHTDGADGDDSASAVGAGDANRRDSAADDVVADRLERLGYLEK